MNYAMTIGIKNIISITRKEIIWILDVVWVVVWVVVEVVYVFKLYKFKSET